jgi:sigma-E factor negative regulatory protein RseC
LVKEQGKIEELNKNTAVVRIQKRSACDHCESKGSCSISNRDMLIEVPNDLQAGVGDHVEVSVPEGTLLKLSAIVYLLPVMALLAGAFLGSLLGNALKMNSSLTAIILGGGFMAIAFFCLILIDRKKKAGNRYYPRMTRILVNATSLQPGDSI